MPFQPYEEVAPERMVLPIRGKDYPLPDVGITDGARIDAGEDIPDEELFLILLGDSLAEMRADNVPAEAFNRAFMAALADTRVGRVAAEVVWETGAVPERVAAKVKEASQLNDSPNLPSSEAAPETQAPATTSGTTSPSGSKPNGATKQRPAKASASRGRRSSASTRSS